MIENLKKVRDALEALLNYQQADIDGVMVLTSRQAIHEVSDYVRATLDRIIAESDKCPDCGALMVLECSGLNHTLSMLSAAPKPAQPEKVIDWAGLDKIRKSATGKTLDQLNAWSYANDTRKAGDNAQEVEQLRKERDELARAIIKIHEDQEGDYDFLKFISHPQYILAKKVAGE